MSTDANLRAYKAINALERISQLSDGDIKQIALDAIATDGRLVGAQPRCAGQDLDLFAAAEDRKVAQQASAPSAEPGDLIAGALYDLMGYLTTRDETIRMGATELATPAADALVAFAKKRGLSLDNPAIKDWSAAIAAPLRANGPETADDEIAAAVFAVLRSKASDPLWKALTYSSGPYEITSLRQDVLDIARAVLALRGATPLMASGLTEPMEDPVTIPMGLISAACAAIRSKADAPNLLEKLRRYTVGDLSRAAPVVDHACASTGVVDHERSNVSDNAEAATASAAMPDMRHPKIQALIGAKARREIELRLVEQLVDEGPDCELTAMDMEYWYGLHDKLKAALESAQPVPATGARSGV